MPSVESCTGRAIGPWLASSFYWSFSPTMCYVLEGVAILATLVAYSTALPRRALGEPSGASTMARKAQ